MSTVHISDFGGKYNLLSCSDWSVHVSKLKSCLKQIKIESDQEVWTYFKQRSVHWSQVDTSWEIGKVIDVGKREVDQNRTCFDENRGLKAWSNMRYHMLFVQAFNPLFSSPRKQFWPLLISGNRLLRSELTHAKHAAWNRCIQLQDILNEFNCLNAEEEWENLLSEANTWIPGICCRLPILKCKLKI